MCFAKNFIDHENFLEDFVEYLTGCFVLNRFLARVGALPGEVGGP